jgi:4-aminobutyrate aminotransferase
MSLGSLAGPTIVGPLPGPKAAAAVERDRKVMSPSYTRDYPLVVQRAEGAMIEDPDGNVFLDITSGIAVCSTGHCHPKVVEAIRDQAGRLIHMSGTDFYYPGQYELGERLAKLAPGPTPKRVFFANSGAEAIEGAVKLAKHRTGRPYVIGFYGGFHGRTAGALSITASKSVQRQKFGPLVPGVSHVDYAYCYRCPLHRTHPECGVACAREIETRLFKRTMPPDEVAAIVVEPVQGEGGYLVPPPDFLPLIRSICDRHGILMIADEVQSGMGRTGRMFACEHFGIEPDILVLAKGIASGLPLGALVAKRDVMTWPPGTHASTFGGNPLACAAALATIDLLESELLANAERVGRRLKAGLEGLKTKHRVIGDVRGLGLMIGMELVEPVGAGSATMASSTGAGGGSAAAAPGLLHVINGVPTVPPPNAKLRNAVVDRAFHHGLLLLGCGENTIRFCPPLVLTEAQADSTVAIVDRVLSELAA